MKKTIDTEVLMKKKMTKKAYAEYQKSQRSTVTQGFNTGTITMKSNKDYSRKGNKVDLRKLDF